MNDNLINTIVMAISIYYFFAGIFKIGFSRKRTQRLISKIGISATRIFFIVTGIIFFIFSYLRAF